MNSQNCLRIVLKWFIENSSHNLNDILIDLSNRTTTKYGRAHKRKPLLFVGPGNVHKRTRWVNSVIQLWEPSIKHPRLVSIQYYHKEGNQSFPTACKEQLKNLTNAIKRSSWCLHWEPITAMELLKHRSSKYSSSTDDEEFTFKRTQEILSSPTSR